MKYISVNGGKYQAKVDDDTYEKLSIFKWHVAGSKKQYACRQFQQRRMKHYVYMHREIMNAPAHMFVDHINGDPLDNRRENLRLCTPSENGYNSKIPTHNTSGHKGVHYYQSRNKWTAKIQAKGKSYNLGYFMTKEEAVAARKAAEVMLHGEFARA